MPAGREEQSQRLRQAVVELHRAALLAMEQGATVEELTYRAMARRAWEGITVLDEMRETFNRLDAEQDSEAG